MLNAQSSLTRSGSKAATCRKEAEPAPTSSIASRSPRSPSGFSASCSHRKSVVRRWAGARYWASAAPAVPVPRALVARSLLPLGFVVGMSPCELVAGASRDATHPRLDQFESQPRSAHHERKYTQLEVCNVGEQIQTIHALQAQVHRATLPGLPACAPRPWATAPPPIPPAIRGSRSRSGHRLMHGSDVAAPLVMWGSRSDGRGGRKQGSGTIGTVRSGSVSTLHHRHGISRC